MHTHGFNVVFIVVYSNARRVQGSSIDAPTQWIPGPANAEEKGTNL